MRLGRSSAQAGWGLRFLGDVGGHDHLLGSGDDLGVIALNRATAGSLEATGVGIGVGRQPLRLLNNAGSGSWSQVICGIDWVTGNRNSLNIRVANMSLGGLGEAVRSCATTTDPLHQAICSSTGAGVTYVVAAGNDGWDFDHASVPDVPAAYPQVLTVTAVSDSDGARRGSGGKPSCRLQESDDVRASFSNFARTSAGSAHMIAAPGVCIRSTWRGSAYSTISGTSNGESPYGRGRRAVHQRAPLSRRPRRR